MLIYCHFVFCPLFATTICNGAESAITLSTALQVLESQRNYIDQSSLDCDRILEFLIVKQIMFGHNENIKDSAI